MLADSAVLSAVNTGMVGAGDFVRAGGAVALTAEGRKSLLRAYEEALQRALAERPQNHSLLKSLFRAFEYGAAQGMQGYVKYEFVRAQCARGLDDWVEPREDERGSPWHDK